MAKFRDSTSDQTRADEVSDAHQAPNTDSQSTALDYAGRPIGNFLAAIRNLGEDQVERILQYQRERGVRFGEAAVGLGLASQNDVLFALSRQFNYTYVSGDEKLDEDLIALNEPFGARAEYFRSLRSQLIMRAFGEKRAAHALAIISPDIQDGRTYCASNLAITLAQLGGRTLLVDADMRSPRIHQIFRLDGRAGLSNLLSGREKEGGICQISTVPSLYVLPAGTLPPNPLELVERPAFGILMRELTTKFDHVVVDTPAALHGADSAVIAARCGLALVVARKNSSRFTDLQELIASFSGSSVQIAGVVLNEQ